MIKEEYEHQILLSDLLPNIRKMKLKCKCTEFEVENVRNGYVARFSFSAFFKDLLALFKEWLGLWNLC